MRFEGLEAPVLLGFQLGYGLNCSQQNEAQLENKSPQLGDSLLRESNLQMKGWRGLVDPCTPDRSCSSSFRSHRNLALSWHHAFRTSFAL